MKYKQPILFVVPIIDTEGPSAGRDDMYGDWESLADGIWILTDKIRSMLRDSFGNNLLLNWFLLDWLGYNANDSKFKRRGHDTKLHAIWSFYSRRFLSSEQIEKTGDGIYWHYHHPPRDGSWGWNADWNDSRWYEYIMAKNILDLGFYPVIYRAGKYLENNQSSLWLEQWIPFDFSSISPTKREFCDWSRAPVNWTPYHPSKEDYQTPGDMKRMIAHSLPIAAKGGSGELRRTEVEKAFAEAKEKGTAIFSFHSHDYYKSLAEEFQTVHVFLEDASKETGVAWKYSNALEALRKFADPLPGALSLSVEKHGESFTIRANHGIFGEMPFVAVEKSDGSVVRLNVEKMENGWAGRIPLGTTRIAASAIDTYGYSAVIRIA